MKLQYTVLVLCLATSYLNFGCRSQQIAQFLTNNVMITFLVHITQQIILAVFFKQNFSVIILVNLKSQA